ncbi:MAG: cellulase family glycosylhydrolase [Acetatifactor sp.]
MNNENNNTSDNINNNDISNSDDNSASNDNGDSKVNQAPPEEKAKEKKAPSAVQLHKQVIHLRIAVAILTLGLVLLGIKCFWPDKSAEVAGSRSNRSSEESGESDVTDDSKPISDAGSGEASEAASRESASSETGSDAPDTDNESGSANTPSPEDSEISDNSFLLTYSAGNSWENGGSKMYGLEMSLTNSTGGTVNGWTLVLQITDLKSMEGWNGTYVTDGDTLTINNAGHNGVIGAGETIYLGGNLGTGSALNIESATLNGIPCTVRAGKVDQNEQNNKNGGSGGEGSETADVSTLLKRPEEAVQGDDWLHTDGRRILDKDGREVWLTGINWFGYNTGTNLFDGLWNSKLEPTVKGIADHGFNLIRVPISAQLINQWAAGEYPTANYNHAYNPTLNSMNSLEIFDYFLALAEANGLKVMIDIHSAETNASGHTVNLWYTDKVSVDDYYAALEWMAARYADNDTIIAYDLKNEPHGKPNEGKQAAIWNDSTQSNNWKYTAETAAARILAKNPNVLILVEGTEIYPKNNRGDYSSTDSEDYYFNWWGGNLRAVRDYPIDLGKYQDKLVYSPHDYGPTVYKQPWFEGSYDYDSLMKDCWHDNWFYIYEEDIAPLLIGEWGGFLTEPNLTWMTHMRTLISKYRINHTFWCLNANSGDTGGLLLDDFTTWDTAKYNFVKEVLWQQNGKFVGLDHAIPLGENGIALKDAAK